MNEIDHFFGELIFSRETLICFIVCFITVILSQKTSTIPPKGCRRLGLPPGTSNLDDEFDPKYNNGVPQGQEDDSGPSWRVKALFSYPLKSCAGVELQVSNVVSTGLEYDRQFTFAAYNNDEWNIRTLRNAGFNRLALIQPEIWVPDPSAQDYDPNCPEVQHKGVLLINYPRIAPAGWIGLLTKTGMALKIVDSQCQFQVPLDPPAKSKFPLVPVKIWKDRPLAYDLGKLLPASLFNFLGLDPNDKTFTLFRASAPHAREIFRNAPSKEELGHQPNTAFADAYPIHLLNMSSHRDVASRCAYAIPHLSIQRFRANIIVQGPSAFEEDHWKRVSIGGTEIHASCRTVRCRLPNVDPASGDRHKSEPDKTLKSYRRIDEGDRTNACLGMQLVPAKKEFVLRVGDEVNVLETGLHQYIKMLAPGEKVEGV
ncbi:Molybdenum cofactor sulfurase C-terminal [Penicillium soppii]|uniref:Molybdenum cofactor sulfurase C-terminal n=1 Tax=Penicillium soppii TaxID=69789 RepID=UPI002548303F|nr:Molybdenum cofactor sulfurase C-terminal [Penicillium soppii]KAJ5864167.1 Molybdenum cofactor sulfurase C-terminal [Penicillium soppii]